MTGFSLIPVDRARVRLFGERHRNRHSSAVRRSPARDPQPTFMIPREASRAAGKQTIRSHATGR
jgi:hypothetical protein